MPTSCFTADHDHGAPPSASHRGQRLFEHGQLARSLEQLVRPAWYGGNDSSGGHAQCCTLRAAVSTVARSPLPARNCPTMGK